MFFLTFRDTSYEYKQHRANTKCAGTPRCPICRKYSKLMTTVIKPTKEQELEADTALKEDTIKKFNKAFPWWRFW